MATTHTANKTNRLVFPQIRAITVLMLGIITLGIYFVVWLIRRQQELPSPAPRFTHWGWLVGMIAAALLGTISLYVASVLVIADSQLAAEVIMYGSYGIGLLFAIGASIWTARITQAINHQLGLALPTTFVMLLALFCVPLLVIYEQLAINWRANHANKATSVLADKFRWFALIGITLGVLVATINTLAYSPEAQIAEIKRSHAELRQDAEKLYRLTADYTHCVDKLERDYPEGNITSENYDAYNTAYDKCEAIYSQIEALGN